MRRPTEKPTATGGIRKTVKYSFKANYNIDALRESNRSKNKKQGGGCIQQWVVDGETQTATSPCPGKYPVGVRI